jgi:hypothetical protein
MFIFSSSDITALFKKDIIKVLSLPKGYCIHFRYSDWDLSDSITAQLPYVIGRAGVIVYAKDNNPDIPIDQRNVKYLPIRRVTVTHYRQDEQTKLHHFNLELGDFIICDITYPASHSMPPFKFVSEGSLNTVKTVSWIEKIEELVAFDASFKEKLFFNVRVNAYNEESGGFVETPFDKREETSYFGLSEGQSYILDLSIYISEENEKEIEKYECILEYDKKDILISNPSSIVIGSQKDNRRYNLVTKAVENIRSYDYLKIISGKKESGTMNEFYETTIRFNIRKSTFKAFLFTVLFLMNLIGTAWFAYILTKGIDIKWIVLPIVMVVGSAVGQYYFYNKSK